MAEKSPTLRGSEVVERLRKAFPRRRALVGLFDHGEDVQIEFLSENGSTELKLDPGPVNRFSTVAQSDVMIAQIKQYLDEA